MAGVRLLQKTRSDLRESQNTQIYEGTNQIQRMVIARKTFSGVC